MTIASAIEILHSIRRHRQTPDQVEVLRKALYDAWANGYATADDDSDADGFGGHVSPNPYKVTK